MTADVLADIDAVLGMQPDLFEHVVDNVFGSPVQYPLLADAYVAGDLDDYDDAIHLGWRNHMYVGPLGETPEPIVALPKFATPYQQGELVEACNTGLRGGPFPDWMMRARVVWRLSGAYEMGCELADQIPWQP